MTEYKKILVSELKGQVFQVYPGEGALQYKYTRAEGDDFILASRQGRGGWRWFKLTEHEHVYIEVKE